MRRRQTYKCTHTQEGRGLEGCVHAYKVPPNCVSSTVHGEGVSSLRLQPSQRRKLRLLFVHTDQSFVSAWTWAGRLGLSEPDPYEDWLSQHPLSLRPESLAWPFPCQQIHIHSRLGSLRAFSAPYGNEDRLSEEHGNL